MAVDPATIKLAVQAATKVLTDEETRKKVIAVAVAPLAAFILIVSRFFYILTMLFHWLSNLFGGNDYNTVVEVRAEHGYDQYIDPTDEDWTASDGVSYLL